jgi:plasmid replication initiation protein
MENVVRKSNILVEAAHRLTVSEQRIILCAIAQVKPLTLITDEVLYTVSTDALIHAGVRPENASVTLREGFEQLFQREVTVIGEEGKLIKTRWVQSISVPSKTNGSFGQLRFSKDLLPYLSNLSSHFTQYYLRDAVKLNSTYAVRIFELIMQYQSVGSRTVDVSELRRILFLEDKYKKFSDFRKSVIDTAVKQISEKTNYHVAYELLRKGKSVNSIKFIFGLRKGSSLEKLGEEQSSSEAAFLEMTDKQRDMFASKLSEHRKIQRLAKVGQNTKDFINWLEKELHNKERIVEWDKELREVGYVPTPQKKPK